MRLLMGHVKDLQGDMEAEPIEADVQDGILVLIHDDGRQTELDWNEIQGLSPTREDGRDE